MRYYSEHNLFEFSRAFGDLPGGQYMEINNVKWAYTGTPVFNRIFDLRADRKTAGPLIGEVIRQFKSRTDSFIWIIGPSTTPRNTASYLKEYGMQLTGLWSGMERTLAFFPDKKYTVPELAIYEVGDERGLRQFVRVARDGFRMQADAEILYYIIRELKANNPSSLFLYLGCLAGSPAGTALMFIDSYQTAGLYFVATLPEYRRRGVATALLGEVLRRAWEKGCRKAVLHATAAGVPLYKKLGFTKNCTYSIYAWRLY